MKIHIIRVILMILLLSTFYIIFGFSGQDGEKSSSVSRKVTEFIGNHIQSIKELQNEQKIQVLNKMESIIRKIAHFSIYTVVGILLMSLLSTFALKEIYRGGISLLIGFVYASSDEIHQSFIPGRSPQVTDVMIDTMGVVLGILLVIAGIQIYRKIKNKEHMKKVVKN